MTRSAMTSMLHSQGEFRTLPNDSSLTAMMAKNSQIIQVGHENVDVGEGVKVKHKVYGIDGAIIKEASDLIYSRPYSSMTQKERDIAVHCPKCKQKRLIKERWSDCLICQRKTE